MVSHVFSIYLFNINVPITNNISNYMVQTYILTLSYIILTTLYYKKTTFCSTCIQKVYHIESIGWYIL